MKCIVCQVNETEGRNNYCSWCYGEKIDELDRRFSKKEAPQTREDHKEPNQQDPLRAMPVKEIPIT